ncbi:MAG: hypothetical protein IKZ62_00510 [Prevotella sp.]|nr:hypothetical protein [Prevotella sp.]
MLLLTATAVQGQITIDGNVYGGGNAGDTGGSTKVTVHAGDINAVFGGARMANVAGSAFVHVDGEHASDSILINKVYGGNDIAGTIGSSTTLPTELTDTTENKIKYTWNAFVRTSTKTTTADEEATDAKGIFIGQIYGGGNGDYDYTTTYSGKNRPVLAKTYLEIKGGTIAHVYGGGNAATVTNNTTIYINNPSKVVTHITDANGVDILADPNGTRLKEMGLNTTQTHASSAEFQFARVFGGNNKADMAIRPRWNLKRGLIRDLYGGGNEGRMTSPEGLLLQIEKGAEMIVDNVFGGCRRADVRPLYNNNDETPVADEDIELDPSDNPNNIPAGYAARVRVLGGHVNNVYGGNDISGNVYGGNTVGIFTHIYGNVYGGGNGSYAYTDNADLKDDPQWSDFYYSPKDILNLSSTTFTGLESAEALNIFRPNAEKVSILVRGTEDKPVVVDGSLYVGGNSASLRDQTSTSSVNNRQTHIKIGSYVTIDNVFLGNNGENMVTNDILERYAGNVTVGSTNYDFSKMNLTISEQFAKYMEGCAMKVKPSVVFESRANGDNIDYVPYSTKFGSFFCGGNVGSILVDGKITVDFEDKVIIYDKVVGGCNNANVAATNYNAEYLGGMLGRPDSIPGSPAGTIGDKLELNFGGLRIQPKRWNANRTELVWNTFIGDDEVDAPTTLPAGGQSTSTDLKRRLKGGNIYGGCYNSGHVNGNVVININESVVDRKGQYAVFDSIQINEGEAILYNNENYNIVSRRSGVILDEQGMDPLGRALNVFGGGYGKDSEIWGGTTINVKAGYVFQIFGGGEKGVVGQPDNTGTYSFNGKKFKYNDAYSCHVNVRGEVEGVYRGHTDDSDDMAEAEFIYGGAFEAPIAGNAIINLGNGRVFNTFAGSCNADILGHTETYVGRQLLDDGTYADEGGYPWIRDHIYGGNDLGGRILNMSPQNFIGRVRSAIRDKVYNPTGLKDTSNNPAPKVTEASAYMEYQQGRVDYIFGGCYGYYDYKDRHYSAYTDEDGIAIGDFIKPRMDNAFVNFRPNNHQRNAVSKIYGAGQGYSGDSDRDIMQDRSYVLIDIPNTVTKYQAMEVFGAGDYSGVGMRSEAAAAPLTTALDSTIAKTNADGVTAAAVIDLMRGRVKDVFGASYKEGVTRRTIVNVPTGSTIHVNRIFGGAYGISNDNPCDVFESNVNYHSSTAKADGDPADIDKDGYQTGGGVYGGNNSYRRTLFARVNVDSPVYQSNGYTAKVFGAGYGKNTWAQYTDVYLEEGADVYEAYGGGFGGMVLNKESAAAYIGNEAETKLSLGTGYLDNGFANVLVNRNELDLKCNTNVHIKKGANVGAYCYAGGLGADATVCGTTYVGLLGGIVKKDIYAGGTSGAVMDLFKLKTFTATTNAYIEGGMARNVFGGSWEGSVGLHTGTQADPHDASGDIPGVANVIVGVRGDQPDSTLLAALQKRKADATLNDYGFYMGVPAIQRNVYGGGEGGAVFGTANLIINNGYIGYTYDTNSKQYIEKLDDETYYEKGVYAGDGRLADCGNAYGGGYDDNSSVDVSNITMWNGVIRNSVFGGGEIATIGRGATMEGGVDNSERVLKDIYLAGGTHLYIYNGKIKRNVFGGGKGYNVLGYGRKKQFYTDGYVFGKTDVNIYGGEIGTEAGVANGDGNVFGGGDVGYVYSPSIYSTKTGQKEPTGSPHHIYYYDDAGNLSEDCRVIVSPRLQIRKNGSPVTYPLTGNDSKTYGPYDYVPTEYLNTLPAAKNNSAWTNLYTGEEEGEEERGVHIYNAVFAGGNVSSNSESYANATTVYGNSTATLYDVFYRDFITVGTEHTGGIYGGGNLSVVDGYRELNITNYGTDYYGLDSQISLEKYRTLSNRERAYFKLEYLCTHDYTSSGNKHYTKGVSRISEEDYDDLPLDEKPYWEQYGFCSIYAGRLLNTIQRADFCGVFGSRMVLQGAKDRVADVGDATVYTINRIGELSLNKQRFTPGSDAVVHGNYFGIYSVVNYLGNLTSDVNFYDDDRKIITKDAQGNEISQVYQEGTSYYDWKTDSTTNDKERNIGTSENQVALASGVFLELTTENSTKTKKDYGYITGVIELDLINVKKDIEGGGYVYAKNEHGERYEVSHQNKLLSPYNMIAGDTARTYKFYKYYAPTDNAKFQTSGNFIHRKKRIIDDCYPNNGLYKDIMDGDQVKTEASPAHYWYIKGDVYIYDQVVSAYAGSASAYSKEVKIPLTITAGSNGRLTLLNVQPNLYAYKDKEGNKIGSEGVKVDNESMTYHLNDVITWWDWHQLNDDEQKCFVKETYVNVDTCTVNGQSYPKGTYVMLPNDSTSFKTQYIDTDKVVDKRGNTVTEFSDMFRPSNNISHEKGYVLTLDMNSPSDWDDWYSLIQGTSTYTVIGDSIDTNRKKKAAYNPATDSKTYREGPTFRLKSTSDPDLYGQRWYNEGEIITQEVYQDYTTTVSSMNPKPTGQAKVERAYVALADVGTVQKGSAISATDYGKLSDKTNYDSAMVCINSIQLGKEEYVLMGDLVSATPTNLNDMATKYRTYYNSLKSNASQQITEAQARDSINAHLSTAYYCTTEGKYGGQYFETGKNYSALKAWCALSDDRDKFEFNYDAFDVLVDSLFPGEGYTSVYKSPYCDTKAVEYKAVYLGPGTLQYEDEDGNSHSISNGGTLERADFEQVKNEQRHYTRVDVAAGGQTLYIVRENFIDNGTPFAEGQDLTLKEYNALSNKNKAKTYPVAFENAGTSSVVLYYCYDGSDGHDEGKGTIINSDTFSGLKNYQKKFTIQGMEPTETTTLYVSRESNAKDVTSEKVITVVYQYTYYEDDDEGEGISLTNELHVINIHLQLESGVPEIGPLSIPPAVLPGNNVALKAPSVNPGLYEVLINGWEMYTSSDDADNNRNGIPFQNNETPLYWYQNQKVWVAFYSKTYLGKTYSNSVPLSVANYHDIADVMADSAHHMYVDYDPAKLDRPCKIYIKDPEEGLNQLKSFIDLSYNNASKPAGHALLDSYVRGGENLEFILQTDITQTGNWTPIANGTNECFEGNFHGDGYTISGLNHSLFGHLCGNVYNLGVTGPFTSAGVADGTLANDADGGYVENCWIKSTATSGFDGTVIPVFNTTANNKIHVVNSYYPEAPLVEDNEGHIVTLTPYYATNGPAIQKDSTEFYNGTVAYNLNDFYLNKRYYDNKVPTGSPTEYYYLRAQSDGTLPDSLSKGKYPSSPDAQYGDVGYVEGRFADGDFIYAGGSIPESLDVRFRATTTGTTYAPIWPDDYLFFGQNLTYGYDETRAHDEQPTRIMKSGGRLTNSALSNRVYRAPAYYQSSDMDVAHFNLWAYLAAKSAPKTITDKDLKDAYPDMTAIDFAGHNDNTWALGSVSDGFYPPLLDNEDGLLNIANEGETPNLLVYAPSAEANEKTYNVLSGYFVDPDYTDYYLGGDYRCVSSASSAASSVHGHLVQGNLKATTDHLLVDKRDFFCPIAYNFDDGYRMWYQRTPDRYVDTSKGWETVSLPFTAELVTTQQKGEITHFYSGSRSVDEKNGTKTGHEYWLREYIGKKSDSGDTFIAAFNYPTGSNKDGYKEVNNTFLWDYYYSANEQKDANQDTYQTYYKDPRGLAAYPLLAGGTPYIVGFPSKTFYEFDLSGEWTPKHTAEPAPAQLEKQIITFASYPSNEDGFPVLQIKRSDDDTGTSDGGYAFKPNYISKAVTGNYLLNTDGDSFDVTTTATTTVPFRPFFVKDTSSGSRKAAQHIIFDTDGSSFAFGDKDPSEGEIGEESMLISVHKHDVSVTSSLRNATDVRIFNVSGVAIASYTIQPGETVTTFVPVGGVYIVRAAGGRYQKKLAVK